MTLYSWGNPRYFPSLPPPSRRYFDVDAESRVAADCHWQPRAWEHPTLIALHGLNGSSDAHYMRGLAAKAFGRGLNVVRLNQRNCGDTERLSAGLFHSGLTADAAHVVHELSDDRWTAGDRGRRLFARRQSRAQAGGRVRDAPAGDAARGRRRLAHHRDRRVRARARAARQRPVSMELRQGSEAPHAPERPAAPRAVRPHEARGDPDGSRIRRGLYGAVLRFPRRRGLLSSRQRDPHHRSHRRADAGHHRRGRSVRPVAAVPRSEARRQPPHRSPRLRARRTLRFRRRSIIRRETTATGRRTRSSSSSFDMRVPGSINLSGARPPPRREPSAPRMIARPRLEPIARAVLLRRRRRGRRGGRLEDRSNRTEWSRACCRHPDDATGGDSFDSAARLQLLVGRLAIDRAARSGRTWRRRLFRIASRSASLIGTDLRQPAAESTPARSPPDCRWRRAPRASASPTASSPIARSASSPGFGRSVSAADLHRPLIARREGAQRVLDAVAELPEHGVGNVRRVLRHEIDADAFGSDQAHDLLDLLDQRGRRVREQEMRLVEEKDEPRLLGIANLRQPLEELGQHPEQKRRVQLRAIGSVPRRRAR